jgi:hypothetical protein
MSFLKMNNATKQARERRDRYVHRNERGTYQWQHLKYARFINSTCRGKVRVVIACLRSLGKITAYDRNRSFQYHGSRFCRIGYRSFCELVGKSIWKDVRNMRLPNWWLELNMSNNAISTPVFAASEVDRMHEWTNRIAKIAKKGFAYGYLAVDTLPVPSELVAEIRSYM